MPSRRIPLSPSTAARLFAFAAQALSGRAAQAAALDAALTTASVSELLLFAAYVREPWRPIFPLWPILDINRVLRLDASVRDDAACLCAASADRDGYIREAAMRRLAGCPAPYARRFLWMRLDDIVARVAAQADAEISRTLPTLSLDALVADAPLFDALATRERARRMPSLVLALRTLSGESIEVRAALRRGLRAIDVGVRNACARRLARDADAAVRVEALTAALADPSLPVHLWAAREAASKKTPLDVSAALAPAMCAHPNPAVRRLGVVLLARSSRDDEALVRATIDVDAAVRFEARAALVRSGARDYRSLAAEVLREATPDASRLRGALCAMYDVGERDDWTLVAPYLQHTQARVRAEALRTLSSLAPELFVDVFVGHLRDSSRRVAREAIAALERSAASMSAAAFRSCVSAETLAALCDDGDVREVCREGLRRVLAR